jgi:hypothetical protein
MVSAHSCCQRDVECRKSVTVYKSVTVHAVWYQEACGQAAVEEGCRGESRHLRIGGGGRG